MDIEKYKSFLSKAEFILIERMVFFVIIILTQL